MNKQVDRNLRFEYIQKLTQAIEAFTSSLENIDPNTFQYRGANLKYAVERNLYFFAIANEQLYRFFCQWVQAKLPDVIELSTELERDLAFYLSGECLEPSRLRVGQLPLSRNSRFLYLTKHKLRRVKRQLETFWVLQNRIFKEKKADVLIHINHPRFINFLQPIVNRLPLSYMYLMVNQQEAKPYFLEQNVKLGDVERLHCLLSKRINVELNEHKKYSNRIKQITKLHDYIYTELERRQPKVLIVIEGNNYQNEIINQVGKSLSIPVICLQQGWSPIIHIGFCNMTYTKMLVWGEGFAELLKPYNPNQNFVVTGSHTVNSGKQISVINPSIACKGVSFFLQSVSKLITKKDYIDLISLLLWTAQEFTAVPLLVREHPRVPLSSTEQKVLLSFPNVKLVPPSNFSLADVLNSSCLTVSIYSSTILESIAAGVVPLIFNTTSMPNYLPDVCAFGAGVEVKTLDEAMNALCQLLGDANVIKQFAPRLEKFRNRYFYQSQQPSDKIAKEILFSANRN